MEKSFIKGDIYAKSNPEEFKQFLTFLDRAGEFDVIMDGQNVLFSPQILAGFTSDTVARTSKSKMLKIQGSRAVRSFLACIIHVSLSFRHNGVFETTMLV